jgi:hypothetical protein
LNHPRRWWKNGSRKRKTYLEKSPTKLNIHSSCGRDLEQTYTLYYVYTRIHKAGYNMAIDFNLLKQQLLDDNYLKLLTFCKAPKSFNEMKTIKIQQSKFFKILTELKVNGALLFADGKYYTSPEVFEYLD